MIDMPMPSETDERYRAAVTICERLTQAGHRALLAGGCVRDLVLGVRPKDYDVATSATPDVVEGLFEKCISVGASFGVQIVVLAEGTFEVATFRKDGPYLDGRHPDHVEFVDEIEDARRRDFTINAMFFDPATNSVIDYVGGKDDLQRRVVRTVGEPHERFSEDHLRLLRAVRFAARLGFTIDPGTQKAIAEMASLISRTSPERIRDEIVKILTEGGARRAFELLDQTGLLVHVLPEVARMKGVQQPPEFHPEGDVFDHVLGMLDLARKPSVTLAMAILLHDVGKPVTQTFEDRIRFNNHDKVGARETGKICRRLRFSNEDAERIVWMVENHMRVDTIPSMRESKRKRFVREDGFSDLLELCRLDCLASHNSLETIEWIERYIASLPPEELKPTPLLGGNDLISMGYEPGPLFSEILSAVEDEQLEGNLVAPQQAREFVLARWPNQRTTPQ
jgi:poly(A) polymerase